MLVEDSSHCGHCRVREICDAANDAMNCAHSLPGLRIKENKEVYEGEVTELTPEEMETEGGGYGKVHNPLVAALCSRMFACAWVAACRVSMPILKAPRL